MAITTGTKPRQTSFLDEELLIEQKEEKLVKPSPKPANAVHVKQLMRWLSKTDITDVSQGFDRVQDIDAQLSDYYAQGYRLFATHYLGQNPEAFGVLYILTLS